VLERMLALGVADGRVMLVDEATGEVKWAVQAHSPGRFARVAMSPEGRFVASVGLGDKHWRLWNAASGAVHRVGDSHDGTGACICAVQATGQRVLQEGCPVVAHIRGIWSVSFSPCGQRFATGGKERDVIVWDVQTGKAERRMKVDDGIFAVCFSVCGARLASGDGKGCICVWDTATGALLFRMHEDILGKEVRSLHFSPTDKNQLVSAGGGKVALWDLEKGKTIWNNEGRDNFAVFSPDASTIATPGSINQRDVQLVDAQTGESLLSLEGHQDVVFSAAFSVDGSKLASGSYDGTCKVWDSSTGALLRTIVVGKPVCSVASGRDWVRDTQRGVAFAMGHHPRLGAGSRVLELEVGVVRMILDRV
jgi:WD40 repeat protein